MANHKGSEGVVHSGANAIAEVRSWSLSESGDVIEDTELADAAKTFQSGSTEWEGSVDCFWDETDTTGQTTLAVGSAITLNLYPEGAASADTYYTGSAIIVGAARQASNDGMVEASYSFKGAGALSETTVA